MPQEQIWPITKFTRDSIFDIFLRYPYKPEYNSLWNICLGLWGFSPPPLGVNHLYLKMYFSDTVHSSTIQSEIENNHKRAGVLKSSKIIGIRPSSWNKLLEGLNVAEPSFTVFVHFNLLHYWRYVNYRPIQCSKHCTKQTTNILIIMNNSNLTYKRINKTIWC